MEHLTRYASLYSPVPTLEATSWPGVTALLSTFTVTTNKFSVPGFSAHVLRAGGVRHAQDVESVTALVFDVDAGTPAQVQRCIDLLRTAGLAAHFYSSHSHTTASPALRLIVPITRPLVPHEYPAIRTQFLHAFEVPCKPNQSGDVSRFWFLPSHPPGAAPFTLTLEGGPYPILGTPPARSTLSGSKPRAPLPEEPPDSEPIDFAALQAEVQYRIDRHLASKNPSRWKRGELLRRLLHGEPLADHGERNSATTSATAALVHAVPLSTPLSHLMLVCRPSLLAMQSEGSKLQEAQVQGMLSRAMAKRAANVMDNEEFRRAILQYRKEQNGNQ